MGAPERREWRAPAAAGAARKRGLGEVLHYFIPEDEQRSARERREVPAAGTPAAAAARWCILATPERPALCALALDVAAVLPGSGASVLAAFPRPSMLPRSATVQWEEAGDLGEDPHVLATLLAARAGDRPLLLVVAPPQLAALLAPAQPCRLDGVLLPVDASQRGVARALEWLAHARGVPTLPRVTAVLIGAADAREAQLLGGELERGARDTLGIALTRVAALERDAASYRALLHGRSVLELDAASRAATSLRELAAGFGAAPVR